MFFSDLMYSRYLSRDFFLQRVHRVPDLRALEESFIIKYQQVCCRTKGGSHSMKEGWNQTIDSNREAEFPSLALF